MPRRRQPELPVYTFRVRILGGYYAPAGTAEVWREIELAANQTLADLGNAIPLAFDFDDPHLWSFFLSGKAWDRATEYALHSEANLLGGACPRAAGRIRIHEVSFPGATGKKEFLFLFDYGDEWHFGVKLRHVTEQVESGAQYPRVVASQGEARFRLHGGVDLASGADSSRTTPLA
jgi:hypothetical protein